MLNATNDEELAFLKSEVVPRRGELYNALREVTIADQRMLENSEGEFADTRRRAGGVCFYAAWACCSAAW